MIGMSLGNALYLVFLLWLVFLLILWWREISRSKRFFLHLSNSHLFHCDQCHHSFILKQPVNLTRCPRCNAICICRRRKDLE